MDNLIRVYKKLLRETSTDFYRYLYEQIKVTLCSTKPRTFQPNKLLINSILENLFVYSNH